MPRGRRKSSREKLMERQNEILVSISQCNNTIKDLEQQLHAVSEELKHLDLAELSELLDQNHLTPDSLREMIENHLTELKQLEQGA